MKELLKTIWEGIQDTCYIWVKEMQNMVKDEGVLIFCILVPLGYPLLYSWIYNNEVIREDPVVVVDLSGSHASHEYLRKLEASPDVHIACYAGNMEEAKDLMGQQKGNGIIYIPADFSKKLGRGEQTQISVYCEMSFFLNYKAIYQASLAVATDMNTAMQKEKSHRLSGLAQGLAGGLTQRDDEITTAPMEVEAVPIFNATNGYGNAIIPGVLILILQQTLLLGLGLSAGTARENNRYDDLVPISKHYNGIFRIVFGKGMAFVMVYAVMAAYITMVVPRIFGFTTMARGWELMGLMVPFILSVTFFGMALSCVVRYRENVMLLVVFTSVPLLFLSGVSWPLSNMPGFWRAVACIFPSTFGIRGFLGISSMGGTLADIADSYHALWIQVFVYFILACAVYRYQINSSHRHLAARMNAMREKIRKQMEASPDPSGRKGE